MQFTSLRFIGFFAVVFALYWTFSRKYRNVVLLAASLFFYGLFGLPVLAVLCVCILVCYLGGLAVEKRRTSPVLAAAVIAALAPLCFFKYFSEFFAGSAPEALVDFSLIPVVGLSFYTFKAIAYLAEIRKGTLAAQHSLPRLALYLSLFPEVSMGPIQRPGDLLCQIDTPRDFDAELALQGAQLILWGYFQKLVVADNLAWIVTKGFSEAEFLLGLSIFFATVLFGLQLYAEFAGYSCIAIGCMQLLGYTAPENFRTPYLSCSVREFWARWHISLSSWLRDYVYIPLGGSRCAMWRCCMNLMITFFISGLWHGTGKQFIVWGLLHGTYLVFGRVTAPLRAKLWKAVHIPESCLFARIVKTCLTMIFVWFGWVFFRSSGVANAKYLLMRIFTDSELSVTAVKNAVVMLGFNQEFLLQMAAAWLVFGTLDILSRNGGFGVWMRSKKAWIQACVCYILVLFILFLAPQGASPSPVYFGF